MSAAELRSTAVVKGNGAVTVEIKVANGLDTWTVSQVSTELPNAGAGAICSLRKNGAQITAMVASGDAAGGDPPVILRPSDALTVEWTGATPGLVATVLAFYDDGRPT